MFIVYIICLLYDYPGGCLRGTGIASNRRSPTNVIPGRGYTVPTLYIFQYPVHMVQWSIGEDCDYDFTLPSPSKVESATVGRTG